MVKKAKLIHSYIQPNCSLSHLHVTCRSSRFTNNYEHEIYFSKQINSFQYLKTAWPLRKTKLTYLTWNIYHSGLLFSNISILKSVGHFLFWQHSKTNKTIDISDSYMYYTLRIFIWNNRRFKLSSKFKNKSFYSTKHQWLIHTHLHAYIFTN